MAIEDMQNNGLPTPMGQNYLGQQKMSFAIHEILGIQNPYLGHSYYPQGFFPPQVM